ncbi:hypothetical protein AB3R30_10560 [Leptolyngbyaceae cyanobacterium UHCC 1019]
MNLQHSLKYLGLTLGALLTTVSPGFAQSCQFNRMNAGNVGSLLGFKGTSISVRDGVSHNAYVRHIGYPGDWVIILAKTCDNEGLTWYRVQFQRSGVKGWIRGDFIFDIRDLKI